MKNEKKMKGNLHNMIIVKHLSYSDSFIRAFFLVWEIGLLSKKDTIVLIKLNYTLISQTNKTN